MARQAWHGWPGIALIIAGSALLLVSAFGWLMMSLWGDAWLDSDTLPAVAWSVGFAVFATAVCAAAGRLLVVAVAAVAALIWPRAGRRR